MIVKMKFINISGPRNDIDRVTDLYLSRYEIQLESALSELKTVDNLRPFVEINPYRDALAKANQFVGYLPNADDVEPASDMGLDDMFELVRKANEDYQTLQEKKEKLKKKIDELRAKQQVIAPFRPVDCDLHKVLNYRYITYRFGRVSGTKVLYTGLILFPRRRRRKSMPSSVLSTSSGLRSKTNSRALRHMLTSLSKQRSPG